MRVALVILHADPAKGGAETYTVDLAHALVREGHDVHVLASTFSDVLDPRVVRVPVLQSGLTRLSRYVCFLSALDRQLAAVAYDVIHAMLPVRRCDLYHPHAGVAAEGTASGHLKHDLRWKRLAAKWANRLNRKRQRFARVESTLLDPSTARAVPVVICLSDYIKTAVRKHYPLPEDRFATLVNAVDLERFDPATQHERGVLVRATLGIDADKVVGLIVAQDFVRKGLREALLAWKQANDPRLVLLVVGKDDFAPYADLAAEGRYPANVIYAGATRDVRPYYAAADFFVLPTRHDPCSLVVLEALAMGLPVISTRFNGACQVMTEGAHGRVIDDPADVSAISRAMSELLDDGRRRAMQEACLHLRQSLSYEEHLNRLLALYQRVMADRR